MAVKDFAGEFVRQRTVEDSPPRRQLLDSDGLVMFIDPTKSPNEWLPSMTRFFSDLRARRAAESRRQLGPPVALVVPKIDLLPHSAVSVAGASHLDGLIHAIRGAGPMNEATTMEAIGRRMRLAGELLRASMPLDDMVAQVESSVGRNRVAVFPVAAFGWHDSPLEELSKLADLQAAHRWLMEHSFGVLDPLLWMLDQMGVYRLPRR